MTGSYHSVTEVVSLPLSPHYFRSLTTYPPLGPFGSLTSCRSYPPSFGSFTSRASGG